MPATLPPVDPRDIVLENIGPHERLRLTAPPGKITVLTGPNGAGKTQVLDAVDTAQRGGRKLASRDGTVGGSARFGGVSIKVGRGGANRRSGDLLVHSLEDRLSIAAFVDPGIKDPYSADEHRIRALLLLAGAEADITRFFDLLPGGESAVRDIVGGEAFDQTDICKMAALVKRDFDAAARRTEKSIEEARRELDARLRPNEGIDLNAPHDRKALEDSREAAVGHLHALQARAEAAEADGLRVAEARDRLAAAEASYTGPSAEKADQLLRAAEDDCDAQSERVEELKRQLVEATSELVAREHKVDSARQALEAARRHEQDIAAWRETVEADALAAPTEDEIAEAREAVEAAREACDVGLRVRDALQRLREAVTLEARLKALQAHAASLRDGGKNTQVVLSKLVGELGVPLRVDGELRLIAQHPVRGECYFEELSMGEKWKLGIDIVLSRAGDDPAMLVIPQEAWESLDGRNRAAIRERIAGTNLSLITAEAQQWVECPACTALNALDATSCIECDAELPAPELAFATYGE